MTAGRPVWTLSSIDASSLPFCARSAALIASQLRSTSPEVEAPSSAKTWGWRLTIFSATRSITWRRRKAPRSSAMFAWNTTWSSRSPSSPASSASSFSSIAWATS